VKLLLHNYLQNFIYCSLILCVNIPVPNAMSYEQTKKGHSTESSMFTPSSRIKQLKTGLTVNRQQVGGSS